MRFDRRMTTTALEPDPGIVTRYAKMTPSQNALLGSQGPSSAEGPMPALEVWGRRGYERVVTLTGAVCTFGSEAESADIAVDDPAVSRVHLTLERVGKTWLVRDLDSRNGTYLNTERLASVQRRLRHGDEIHAGRTRLVYLDHAEGKHTTTETIEPPPDNITKSEKKVLIELCRPVLSRNALQSAASRREIAARLFVGEQAVQQHLTHLYDKFGIPEEPRSKRREMLANAAMQRGVVTLADLDEPRAGNDGGET
jgi:DNA-binding CsgD family transcriptional regulator